MDYTHFISLIVIKLAISNCIFILHFIKFIIIIISKILMILFQNHPQTSQLPHRNANFKHSLFFIQFFIHI
jgi:hypothetical protein